MAEKEAQAKIVLIENLQIELDLYKKKQKEKEESKLWFNPLIPLYVVNYVFTILYNPLILRIIVKQQ